MSSVHFSGLPVETTVQLKLITEVLKKIFGLDAVFVVPHYRTIFLDYFLCTCSPNIHFMFTKHKKAELRSDFKHFY